MRTLKLEQLKVPQLKAELEKRGLDTVGQKIVLVQRLLEALEAIGEDPDVFEFQFEEHVDEADNMNDPAGALMAMLQSMKAAIDDQKNSLENRLDEQKMSIDEQKNSLENRLDEQKNSLENRLDEQKIAMNEQKMAIDEQQKTIETMTDELKGVVTAEVATVAAKIDERYAEMESKMLEVEDRLGVEVKKVDNKVEMIETEVKKVDERLEKEVNDLKDELAKVKLEVKHAKKAANGTVHTTAGRMKSPQFDGQTSWTTFKCQFNIVADNNGWDDGEKKSSLIVSLRGQAADLFQAHKVNLLSFEDVVKILDQRYGNEHLQDVYRVQLLERRQDRNESLQQLEADIEKLVNLSYPTYSEDQRNEIAVQAFANAIRDESTKHHLLLNKRVVRTLGGALALALEAETVFKNSSRKGYVREVDVVERLTGENIELADVMTKTCEKTADTLIDRLTEVLSKSFGTIQRQPVNQPRGRPKCWGCHEVGHMQRDCPKLRRGRANEKSPTINTPPLN